MASSGDVRVWGGLNMGSRWPVGCWAHRHWGGRFHVASRFNRFCMASQASFFIYERYFQHSHPFSIE